MRGRKGLLLDRRSGEEVRDPVLDRVTDMARRTMERPFDNLFLILHINGQHKIALAHRAAENGKERSPHISSLISII
jgi:hypothetical protein